ncbi:DUF1295 domain-containing protein [Nocardioides sp.]|uniref:DUF1295 domain-containing protein n=1 Tax=Nocardioides sp. TaxID=35761 RepID=UPI003518DC4C
MTPLLAVLLAAGVVLVSMGATALRARQLDKVAVIDVAWGAGFVLVALVTALVAQATDDGDPARRWLLVALTAAWGLRLAWHVRSRAIGAHAGAEDPRYAELLGGPPSQIGMLVVLRRVFLVQTLAQWFVALPVAVGVVSDDVAWPVVAVGVAVWALGLFFETVGDRQLNAYKARPRDERPPVLDTGLWAWTRHPNYFGDACVWWGLWLIGGAASGWELGLATVLCPLAMTLFLRNVTGAKLLEKTMMQRPAFQEYATRVPMFVPRPPRRR